MQGLCASSLASTAPYLHKGTPCVCNEAVHLPIAHAVLLRDKPACVVLQLVLLKQACEDDRQQSLMTSALAQQQVFQGPGCVRHRQFQAPCVDPVV